jgi:multidrug efflux system membrane fusion protein
MKMRINLLALSLAALLAALALSACSSSNTKAAQKGPPTVPVTVTQVAQKDVPLQISSIGNVEAYSTVQIKSQVNAQVLQVHFAEGQDVQKGQLLFTLDAAPFEADLHRAEATLAKDQAQLANARSQAARWQQLGREGVAAREQVDQITANAQALEATVKADEAAIESARVQLQYTKIYAPISGRTGNLLIKAGNLVKANDTPFLVTINQVSPIYVNFAVPEASLAAIKRYQPKGKLPVAAAIPNQPGAAQGVLTFVDNAVDPATGTIKLKATFENTDHKLWPGQFVNTVLTLTVEPRMTVIPAQALQTGQKGNYVYIVKSDRTAERRDVAVERTLGNDAVISTGLQAGETVITDGQSRVVPGQSKVEFKATTAAAAGATAEPPAKDASANSPRALGDDSNASAKDAGSAPARQDRAQ